MGYRKLIPVNAFLLAFCSFLALQVSAQRKHGAKSAFMSYKGLVMAGYQGWFNAKGDGGDRGWNHYTQSRDFGPGAVKVDLWPEVSEYKKVYPSPFEFSDGRNAPLFSSYDASTVDLHFKWMKQYGIDGAFVQRFVSNLKDSRSLRHNNHVLGSALVAAAKHKRAIAVMYDFSGMNEGDENLVIADFKYLVDSLRLTSKGEHQSYLYHNGKPLVALWGIGFNGKRRYGFTTVKKIIDFLKNDPVYGGCAILVGVPAQWRELKGDAVSDPALLEICRQADIIHPWFVGRFNEGSVPVMMEKIKADLAWCRENHIDYVPVVYPGFSWHNMRPNSPSNQISRNAGSFYWKQLYGAISTGAEMVYVAMFDEIDEGTAIFKISKNPPVGKSTFVTFEKEIPEDYYMYLTGIAAKMLRKELPLQAEIPLPRK